MKEICASRMLVVCAMAALLFAGCKNGKNSTTAAKSAGEPSQPSGTMTLRGMYSYMADAALFADCATGARWPVATEGDNAALERAYLSERTTPGAPLLVTVEGRTEPRPRIDGPGEGSVLIVERFVGASPEQSCASMDAVTLEDTHWQLLELNGRPVEVHEGGKAPYLELNSKKSSAYGFGGCNRFFGSYRSTGETLEIGALGATRMACPEGMDREQELFSTLGTVNRYEIHDVELMLFAGETRVARFEARAPAE